MTEPNERAESSRLESRDPGLGTDASPGYILVIDDEPVVREFIATCLSRWGYHVQQAASAAEALDLMIARPASLVLCDVRMPDHDGLWLAERLRADWPRIPVVMASGIDDVETVGQSKDRGALDYITKPITPAQLREVVRRVLDATERNQPMAEDEPAPLPTSRESDADAEYTLESPVRCPACGERITTIRAIRLVRAQVNFTSTLPRRGRVLVCPHCLAMVPAELTNF